MATVAPIDGSTSASPSASGTTAQSAFGLDFQSLLKIVLTELTYQDSLKPVDNYEFVSQLGQFSQLQLSETLNSSITQLLNSQSAEQAAGLIGKTIDAAAANGSTLSGQVTAVAFSNGTPSITITTTGGSVVGNIAVSSITQIH